VVKREEFEAVKEMALAREENEASRPAWPLERPRPRRLLNLESDGSAPLRRFPFLSSASSL
jgi:hypothetical protein